MESQKPSTALSCRVYDTVEAVLPKVSATIAERTRTGPDRRIDLATAENWLPRREIVAICKDAIQDGLTEALSYSDGFGGDPELKEALAAILNRYFHPVTAVEAQDLVVTPGASSCLDSVLFSLCDAGDSVLVVAPYWGGFDFHFALRPAIKIVPVYTESVCGLDTDRPDDLLTQSLLPALEKAMQSCGESNRAKALVVTNPHNPIARCYPKHILREIIHWCGSNGLHYISDEVYALCNFSTPGDVARADDGTEGTENREGGGQDTTTAEAAASTPDTHHDTPFTSALAIELDADKAPPISVIWSTSKDLGSSGFRIGVHVARNHARAHGQEATQGPSFLSTVLGLLSTTQLPTISMLLTHALLSSQSFDRLVALNRERLREHHGIITRRLRSWRVRFVPATSGPYVLAHLGTRVGDVQRRRGGATDLRLDEEEGRAAKKRKLSVLDYEGEDVISVLRREGRVLVSPGSVFHMRGTRTGSDSMAGWARITFAVPAEVLEDGLGRIGRVLGFE